MEARRKERREMASTKVIIVMHSNSVLSGVSHSNQSEGVTAAFSRSMACGIVYGLGSPGRGLGVFVGS